MDRIPRFKKEKEQAFLVLAFTIVALCFFGIFAINPTISTIITLRKELEDDKAIDAQLQQKITSLGLLQTQYSQISNTGELKIIYAAVPPTPDITSLIGKMQTIANQTGITLSTIQISEAELANKSASSENYGKFAFTIEAKGSIISMKNFLTELADFDRIITLDTLAVANKEENGGSTTVTIRGSAYYKHL